MANKKKLQAKIKKQKKTLKEQKQLLDLQEVIIEIQDKRIDNILSKSISIKEIIALMNKAKEISNQKEKEKEEFLDKFNDSDFDEIDFDNFDDFLENIQDVMKILDDDANKFSNKDNVDYKLIEYDFTPTQAQKMYQDYQEHLEKSL